MSLWNAVVIIVAILAFSNIRMAKLRRAGAPLFDGAISASPRELELEREVESLRARIHVLERIATDANTVNGRQTQALAAEIESLRDR
ncbi:hypothetical protein [Novosphingobium sp.]|uniref:hypothetical protein n=1 Tax=Novosphingobium sp. TaxID=1874826 RepID=UPI0035B4AAEE